VAAEGAGIHCCLALPALYLPSVPLFSHVSPVAVSAAVGAGQELGGDSAGVQIMACIFLTLVHDQTTLRVSYSVGGAKSMMLSAPPAESMILSVPPADATRKHTGLARQRCAVP
jgi:hypothetical protein